MRAAAWHGRHDVRIEERERPTARAGAVVIRVGWCGVCGTDVHEYQTGPHFIQAGSPHRRTGVMAPIVIGHEFAGVVEEVGPGVQGAGVGDRVAVNVAVPCGECRPCRMNATNLCEELCFLGSHAPGGFAELVAVPADAVHVLPEALSITEASLTDPLATAVHAVRIADRLLGERVYVSGGGPVGLSILQAARVAGAAHVTCAELPGARATLAASLGATEVIDPSTCPPQPGSFDVAFEASGNARGFAACVDAVRPRGKVVVVSIWGDEPAVDLNRIVTRERRVLGSLAYTSDEFQLSLELMAAGDIDVAPYVTSRIGLEDLVPEALESLPRRRDTEVKVMVKPDRELPISEEE